MIPFTVRAVSAPWNENGTFMFTESLVEVVCIRNGCPGAVY